MKILRTLPFVLVALLSVQQSADGEILFSHWLISLILVALAAGVSLLGYTDEPQIWGTWNIEERPNVRRRRQAIIGLSLMVMFSVTALQWPLRVNFWLARPALDRIALQTGLIEMPQQAGHFSIESVSHRDGETVLWTDSGNEVFILRAPGQKHGFSGDNMNLDSRWYFYSEM